MKLKKPTRTVVCWELANEML